MKFYQNNNNFIIIYKEIKMMLSHDDKSKKYTKLI